jgi:predicted ABC-type ATPase
MYMLAGPNGAGKSTLYERRVRPVVSPEEVPFINADIIQRDELKDPSMQASYKAAEIAESRRRAHLAEGKSFVSESTFSHESKLALIQEARDAGFRVVMYHVNVRSADLSVDRVAKRFKEGGHNVPEDKIRERYARNQGLIKRAVSMADRAFVYDNSTRNAPPEIALRLEHGKVVAVADKVPAWARQLYAEELARFSPARLNAAAASFADAKSIVAKLGGPDAQLRIPEHGHGKLSRGEIVGETAEHWLQKTGEATFVAHFKTAVQGNVRIHREYAIGYVQRGRGLAQELPADLPARAQAFQAVAEQRLSRDEALKRHPELRPAFNALSVAKLKFAQEPERLAEVRDGLQTRLNAGEIPGAEKTDRELGPEQRRAR